jgi:Arc/MetJ-type ribon-helix-helix transcriptional regulator
MDINGNNQNMMIMEIMTKKRIAVTVSEDLLKWVDRKVKDTTFANRSHAIEHALTQLRQSEEKE